MARSIYPPPGAIKSIQRGTTTGNVTITATNMTRSVLSTTGWASASNSAENASLIQTGATTLTYSKGSLTGTPAIAWQLVEYF